MKIKPALFVFITIIAFVFNCSKSDETYTIEMKDGVKHIHNHSPLWGDKPKVELEFVQKIGDLETEDENYQLYMPQDIAVDNKSNIYILDNSRQIRKYDKHGKYLATIGRRGQGPGEFVKPIRLYLDSENNLYVSDPGIMCLMVLTNDGKEIKRIRSLPQTGYLHMTHAGNIIVPSRLSKILRSENLLEDTRLISLYDMNGNLIKKFGEVKDYDDEWVTESGNDFEMCVDLNDNIYAAFKQQNRIEKYSPDGDLIFRADRPLNYKVGLDKEKSKVSPQFKKVSENIRVDHKNRLWVHTYKKQKEGGDEPGDYFTFEIFNSDGILLGHLTIPQDIEFMRMRIFQDHLYLLDWIDEMCLYEYKIVDK